LSAEQVGCAPDSHHFTLKLLEPAGLDQHQHDQQPAEAAIAIEKRVDRLELHVSQPGDGAGDLHDVVKQDAGGFLQFEQEQIGEGSLGAPRSGLPALGLIAFLSFRPASTPGRKTD
jgi:hypothetical protein